MAAITDHSWRCVPIRMKVQVKKSGSKHKGSPMLRRILCQVAHAARKTTTCQFKGLYAGLVIRRGIKRSIIAVGHKILRIIYAMLKNKAPYQEPGIDYEALVVSKNAARWMKALYKYGYLTPKPAI